MVVSSPVVWVFCGGGEGCVIVKKKRVLWCWEWGIKTEGMTVRFELKNKKPKTSFSFSVAFFQWVRELLRRVSSFSFLFLER
jgi:hypothetical protein